MIEYVQARVWVKYFTMFTVINVKPEDHWSCIAHLASIDQVVIEEKKLKNVESE